MATAPIPSDVRRFMDQARASAPPGSSYFVMVRSREGQVYAFGTPGAADQFRPAIKQRFRFLDAADVQQQQTEDETAVEWPRG